MAVFLGGSCATPAFVTVMDSREHSRDMPLRQEQNTRILRTLSSELLSLINDKYKAASTVTSNMENLSIERRERPVIYAYHTASYAFQNPL